MTNHGSTLIQPWLAMVTKFSDHSKGALPFLTTLSPSKKQATVYGKNLLTLEIDHFSE